MNPKNESRGRLRLPSPAMVVAVLAMMVALGGSALAVTAAKKNSVVTKSIKNGAVKTKKLADGAVKEAKIASAAVTEAKLADGSVSSAKIADNAVTGAKIADDSVTNAEIANDAVGNGELDEESVSVGKIEPGALQASRFFQASTFTNDFPEIAGNSCTTIDPTGFEQLQATDRVIVSTPTGMPAQLIIRANAEAGDILFTMCNISTGPINPGNLGFPVLVIR
jgi:hypothetical protein